MEIDLRGMADATKANFRKALGVPTAEQLQEIVTVNAAAGLLLASDTQGGALHLIDVKKGKATLVQKDTAYLSTNTACEAGQRHIGIDGLFVRGTTPFFLNNPKATFGTVPINPITGKPTGKPTMLLTYGSQLNSFILNATRAAEHQSDSEACRYHERKQPDEVPIQIGGHDSSRVWRKYVGQMHSVCRLLYRPSCHS